MPQAATNFLAYKSGGTLFLLWEPPVSGPAPSGYVLQVTGSYVGSLPLSSRSFAIAAPPGTFTLAVAATNACGTGVATTPKSLSFP